VAVPKGQLKRYNPETGDIEIVADGLAYDKAYYEKFFGTDHPAKTRAKYYRRIKHGQVRGGGSAARTAAQEKQNLLRYTQAIARDVKPQAPRPGVMGRLRGFVRKVFRR
ncbi:MAG: hypothetical protein AAFN92_20130, partial [Bacteroidota bacterium]